MSEGNHWALRQDNLGYYFLESERKHGRGQKDTEERKGSIFKKLSANTSTNLGAIFMSKDRSANHVY